MNLPTAPLLHTYLSLMPVIPLYMCITGPERSGKTTAVQNLLRAHYSITNADMRLKKKHVFLIDTFMKHDDLLELYQDRLETFCRTKDPTAKITKTIWLDDADQFSTLVQQQFYAIFQRHRDNIHVFVTCTNINRLYAPLLNQGDRIHLSSLSFSSSPSFLPSPLFEKKSVLIEMKKELLQSLRPLAKSSLSEKDKKEALLQMVHKWHQWRERGVLFSDIVVYIGKSILESPLLTDLKKCELYDCFSKQCFAKEHDISFYFLAEALCSVC